jgi:hypothetical protein
LSVHVEGKNGTGSLTNISGAVIDVFSVMPLALQQVTLGLDLASVSTVDNPYFVEVGSGTTDGSGRATVPLSPVFTAVVAEWRAVAAPPTANVSLQLEVTDVVVEGSNASLFHYYDQVGYDPQSSMGTLVAEVVLNLSTPYATGLVKDFSSSPTASPSGACTENLTTTWTTVAFSVTPGILPVAGAIDNLSGPLTEEVGILDSWVLSPTVEIGFGGVQAAFPGLVEASVHPAWTGIIPNFGREGAAAAGNANATVPAQVAELGFEGVTYLVVGQREQVRWMGGTPCGAFAVNVTFVTSSLPLAATGLPVCNPYGCQEIFYSRTWANGTAEEMEALPGHAIVNNSSLTFSAEANFSSLVRPDRGYATTLAAEGRALNTSYAFSLNLGDAALLADFAWYGCTPVCSSMSAQEYALLLGTQFGPALSELPSLGIFGFSSEIGSRSVGSIQTISYFANLGTSASLFLEGGSNQTALDINGTLYETSMPELGPVLCNVGTSPGSGC